MKIKEKISVVFLMVLTISLSAQKVTVDLDKSVDFSNYKSIHFLGWQKDSNQLMNDFDKDRMRDAFTNEFNERNMVYVDDDADIEITLYLVLEQKTSTSSYTNYYGGAYSGYRRGGWGWGNGYASTTYSENDYIKGTLVMDVYDAKTKNLIWQSVASGTVKENPKKREKSIPKGIKKMMKKFPIKPIK